MSEEKKGHCESVCVGGHGLLLNLLNNSNTLKVIVRLLCGGRDGGGRADDATDARADATVR